MLSVIVPVYNVERYLDRCVESILNQTYQDLELILVDDGSTDASPALCNAWASRDSRVRVIHQQNAGPSVARNSGLAAAQGEWITFVDSDDYLERQCYEQALHTAQNSQCDMCIFGVTHESEQGEVLGLERYEEAKVYAIDELLSRIVIPLKTAVWNKIFHRSLLSGIRFSTQYRHNEDLLFIVESLKETTRAVSCACVGYHYVERAGSITGSGFTPHSVEEVAAKDKAYELIASNFPRHAAQASVLSFIARLNLLRQLEKERAPEYSALRAQYKQWLAEYYAKHARLLSRKHRLIYMLYRYHLSFLLSPLSLFR